MRSMRGFLRPLGGALAIAALGALAWAAGPSEAKAWSLKEAAAPYAGTTINMICQGYPPCMAVQALAPGFEEESGIKVNFELVDLDTAGKKGLSDVITKGGYYDIVEVQGIVTPLWAEQGFATPYEPFLNDPALRDPGFSMSDLIPELVQMNCIYRNAQVCMPKEYFISFGGMRKDILADPGEREAFKAKYGYDLPPAELVVEVKDYQQWADMAQFFTRKAGEKLAGQTLDHNFYGISVSFKRYLTVWYDFAQILYALGGELYDKDYNVRLDTPEAIAALQFMLDMRAYAPPSYAEYTWDEQYSDFCKGNTFSGWVWADVDYFLEDENDCPASAFNVTHFLYPGTHKSVPWANTWVIPSSSQRKEAAYLFVQWITEKDTEIEATRQGWLPNREDVLGLDEWAENHRTAGWTRIHLEALRGGYLTAIHPHPGFQALMEILMEELSSAAVDGRPAEEVMHAIQAKAEQVIVKP